MNLKINGENRNVEASSTVSDLLRYLGLATDGIAVSLNGAIIPRSQLTEQPIGEGDAIEIVRAVGGG